MTNTITNPNQTIADALQDLNSLVGSRKVTSILLDHLLLVSRDATMVQKYRQETILDITEIINFFGKANDIICQSKNA